MLFLNEYKYVIINKDLLTSVKKIEYILKAESLKVNRNLEYTQNIVNTFFQVPVSKISSC